MSRAIWKIRISGFVIHSGIRVSELFLHSVFILILRDPVEDEFRLQNAEVMAKSEFPNE